MKNIVTILATSTSERDISRPYDWEKNSFTIESVKFDQLIKVTGSIVNWFGTLALPMNSFMNYFSFRL